MANAHAVRVTFGGAPFLGLWAKPGADYVCIEPWVSLPSHSAFVEDFAKQEHMIHLPAGETYCNEMTITLE